MKFRSRSRRAVGIVILSALGVQIASAQRIPESRDVPPLSGLWVGDLEFGPPLTGTLTVQLAGGHGQAEIGRKSIPFEVQNDSIRFDFGPAAGRFRGRIERREREIRGFWIQPPTTDAMGPFGQAYATPTRLGAVGADRYRGDVEPVPNRFTLYLYMWSDSTGWRGAFRNPQFNLTGGASRFRIRSAGDSLHFSAKFSDPSEPEIRLGALWSRGDSTLRVAWQGLETPVVLRPCSAERAGGFWPRAPGQKHPYRTPSAERDDWPIARAASVGLDEKALARFSQSLADTNPAESRAPLVHACLIERHGKLVYEEYFFGFDRDTPHDLRSAAKTFASVLVGTAQRQGAPIGPDSAVYASMQWRGPFANPDPRKARITIGQLLTHTSGLACDDNDESSPGAEWKMQQSATDWWKQTLDLPVAFDPGTHYAYCSGGTNLVGGTIAAATGRWLPEFFDATLARPLRFGRYAYNLMPTGEGYLGGGVQMRPRDLLKLGRLYLDGGVWQGQRLVDSTWVRLSTTDRVAGSETAEGYAWHLNTLKRGDREYREYEANGNGGQLLIVLPELDMAIVFTAGNYMMYGIWRQFRDDFVPNRIIAAVHEH